MTVYDVIQRVIDNKHNSYPLGEHLEATFRNERDASEFTARCNDYCGDRNAIEYYFEAIDDENKDRKVSIKG